MSGNTKRYVILTPFKKADVLAGICKLHGLDVWVVPSKNGAMVVHDMPVPVFDDWDISELLGGAPGDGEGADKVAATEEPSAEGSADSKTEALAAPADAVQSAEAGDAPAEPSQAGSGDGSDAGDGDKDPDVLDADDRDAVARKLASLTREGVIALTAELGEDVGNEEGVSGLVTALAFDYKGKVDDVPAGLIVATGESVLEEMLLGDTEPSKVKGAIRSGEIQSNFLEKLAKGKPDAGEALPPRRPRRFFGKDGS
ncbi:MAG: hypothetical protein ACTHWJ_09930 [Flaviflexus sp.]|uniref:hypothetical protein n=1 Tax=Flaviflexus sp. TaxID=1969482 RepID=UPI003F90C32A